MLYFLYGLTIMYGFVTRKSKYMWIFILVLFCFLSITSTTYADIIAYTNAFDLANDSGISILNIKDWPLPWTILCKIAYALGFNYRGMILLVLCLSMYLMHRFVQKVAKNESVFWSCFLLFPGLLNIVQLRFFLAISVLLQMVPFLIKNEKHDVIKAFIIVVIASWIHSSCIIFLLLIPFVILKKEKIINNIFVIPAIIVGSFLCIKYIPQIASLFVDSARMNRYFLAGNEAMPINGIIKVFLLWLFSIGLSVFCIKITREKNDSNIELIDDYNYFSLFSCYLCGICIPLLLYDANFFRIIEIGYMLLYVSIANLFSNDLKERLSVIKKYDLFLTLILITVLHYAIFFYAPKETVIYPLLEYQETVDIFLKKN